MLSSGKRRIMSKLLESLFNIRPEEQKKAIVMLLYSTCMIAAAFVVGRTVSSTLFLKRIDPKYLPFVYVASAIFVSLFSVIYTRIGDKLRQDRTIMISFAIFAVLILLLRGVLEVAANSLLLMGALYVFVEVIGTIAIIQFWIFANDVYTTREAKRLFAFIGAGGTIASMVFGGLVRTTVKAVGTPNLLFLIATLFIICIFLVRQLGRMFSEKLEEQLKIKKAPKDDLKKSNLIDDFNRLVKSNHLITIASSLVIISIVVVIIDYQFMITVRESFGNENALAAFFGSFYLYTGVAAFVLQFFITTRLLERYGILFALLFLPVILLLISVGVLVVSAPKWILSTTAGAKGSDNVIRYSINNPTFQLLYLPVSADFRSRAKAMIDGIIKPVAAGFSGLLIFVLVMFISHKQLSFVVISMIFVWILLIIQARRQYMLSLTDSIKKRKLDLYGSTLPVDESTIKSLEKTLQGDNERNAFNALELLAAVPDKNWDPIVIKLLSGNNNELKKRALKHLGREGNIECAYDVSTLFEDKDPEVRAAALDAYCTIQGERGIMNIIDFIHDPDPLIKSTVIASMIQHGGIDGILMAADELKTMLNSHDWKMRLGGARVLEIVKVKQFYQPLETLLQDEDIRVQIGAIRAASEIKNSFLLPALVEKLSQRKTARTAAMALTRYREDAIQHLSLVLKDNDRNREVRMQLPRIIRHIGTQQCLNMLMKNLDVEDIGVRYNIITEIARMVQDNRLLAFDTKRIEELITDETKNYYQQIVILWELEGKIEDQLLGEALQRRIKKTSQRLLALLSLIYSGYPIDSIAHGLGSYDASTRANSVELLDNILKSDIKRPILAIFEDGNIEKKLNTGKTLFNDLEEDSYIGWLGRLLKDQDQWIVSCTIYQVGVSRIKELQEDLEQFLYGKNHFHTETSLVALRHFMDKIQYRDLLKELAERSTHHAELARARNSFSDP